MAQREAPPEPKVLGDRAQWAWDAVQGAKNLRGDRYLTLARKLPTYLQTHGMGQTLAFLFSNANNPSDAKLLDDLDRRIRAVHNSQYPHIVEVVIKMTPSRYRQVSQELSTSAIWLKRFAEGVLKKDN